MSKPRPLIAIASDHAGFMQKAPLVNWLREEGYQVTDFGPDDDSSVDYPDFANAVAQTVRSKQADLGILVCGTGIGMAIAANKVAGIRAATLYNETFARLSREHNAANIAALSARYIDFETNRLILAAFLNAEPLGERHARRVGKITDLEARWSDELS